MALKTDVSLPDTAGRYSTEVIYSGVDQDYGPKDEKRQGQEKYEAGEDQERVRPRLCL